MKKILIVVFLLFVVNCFSQNSTTTTEPPKQEVLRLNLVQTQPGILRFENDTSHTFQNGLFLYFNPTMLQTKPKSVSEIIAYYNYINAILEARSEK